MPSKLNKDPFKMIITGIMLQARTYTLRVLELLDTAPSLTSREIADSLGIDVARAKDILERLRLGGYVEKVGRGYAITQRGKSLLAELTRHQNTSLTSFIQGKTEEKPGATGKTIEAPVEQKENSPTGKASQPVQEASMRMDELVQRLKEIEIKVRDLEARIHSLENYVRELAKSRDSLAQATRDAVISMEEPVMSISEAQSRLGSLLERYLVEGRLTRIGSLIVDSAFLEEFKKKFPIKASDVARLSTAEKTLLEEMRREALVILYAGREYRLVSPA